MAVTNNAMLIRRDLVTRMVRLFGGSTCGKD